MRRMKTLSLLALTALLAEPAFAAPVTLAPTSGWVVQSADETCRVLRGFGTGSDEVTLSFEQAAMRTPMTMMATGGPIHIPTLKSRSPAMADFVNLPLAHFVADGAARSPSGQDVLIWSGVSFRPSGHVGAVSGSRGRRGGGGVTAIVPLDVQKARRDEDREREKLADALDLQIGRGGEQVRLLTGPMSEPMNRLRACMNRQLLKWGLLPATELTIVKPPSPQTLPTSWLEFEGASRIGLKTDELSPVTVRLVVDETGKVRSCKADAPRDGDAFENGLCANVTRKAMMLPAKTADGRSVASYYITTIQRRR
jgi:hypothetical protein